MRDRFRWLSHGLAAYLEAEFLTRDMPRGRETLVYRDRPRHLDAREVDGKRHVVFNSYYLQPAVCKKSWALRDTGQYYTTFVGCCIREDQRPERFFDQYYEVEDYNELYGLLAGAAPYAIQSVIQPLVNGAVAVECARLSGARAIIDINDSLYFMRTDHDCPECRLEREILNASGGFVHKMPAWGVDKMRRDWGLTRPDHLVHSLAVRELFQEPGAQRQGQNPRLVFAGGIVPRHIALSRGHENHIMDPLIDACMGGGLDLTFYVNQNARNMFWEEHAEYLEMAGRHPGFDFRPGVPFFELPGHLAHHDFAIYYENIPDSSYMPDHFAINMATKIFSYVEAGLPVIIHTQAPYMRELVEEQGFGLVYSLDAMDRIADIVSACDYDALCRNLSAYRNRENDALVADMLDAAYAAA